MEKRLLDKAMVRADEQAVLFSHTRPDGASCFSANKNMNAENVAINQSSATAVMKFPSGVFKLYPFSVMVKVHI